MTKKILAITLGIIWVLASSACKRDGVNSPSPVGPSTLADVLKVTANPNVLYATSVRCGTSITASLKKYDGTALSNKTVYFVIGNINGSRVNIGFFEGHKLTLSRTTDSNGNISVVYYGPLASEIRYNTTTVYIWATVAMEGNEFISDSARVDIIRDP